jgi:hypothetical protein
MTAHVVEICARSRIRIRWIKGYRARALGEFFEIEIAAIRSAITYGTALHEIGHCLGRYQTSRSVIVVERWAWEWARRNALVWTPGVERSAAKCLARMKHVDGRRGSWTGRPDASPNEAAGGIIGCALPVRPTLAIRRHPSEGCRLPLRRNS